MIPERGLTLDRSWKRSSPPLERPFSTLVDTAAARSRAGRYGRRIPRLGLAAAALTMLVASGLPAQESGENERTPRGTALLVGTVVSAETGRPVDGAAIVLPALDVTQVADRKGAFLIRNLPSGRYELTARYLGFRSDTVTVDLTHGATTVVDLALETEPVELPTLVVETHRVVQKLGLAGFYERKVRGLGRFITADDLERRDLVSAFRMIPGVRVDQCVYRDDDVNARIPLTDLDGQTRQVAQTLSSTGGGFRAGAGCYTLRIGRGHGLTSASRECEPEIWIDGHMVTAFTGEPSTSSRFERLRNLPRHLIEGVEVYRNGTMAPAAYGGFASCGVVLVWMKER